MNNSRMSVDYTDIGDEGGLILKKISLQREKTHFQWRTTHIQDCNETFAFRIGFFIVQRLKSKRGNDAVE